MVRANTICPYCQSQKVVELSIIHPQSIEVQCDNPKCYKNWHSGVYRSNILMVEHQSRRGLGKDRPTIYQIRHKTGFGGENLLEFNSRNKSIIVKRGDVCSLSFSKTSKGILHKQWTGEWAGPTVFDNLTIHHYWML